MAEREKVIEHFYDCLAASRLENMWVFVRTDIVGDAIALLKEQPEVVRCRDCKHRGKGTCSAGAGIAYPPPDDWFCADGEMR